MKKLLLGILALFTLNTFTSGQALTAREKNVYGGQMVGLVFAAKATYTTGQTQAAWMAANAPAVISVDQKKLLETVYTYVSRNTSATDIANADNSLLKRVANSTTPIGTGHPSKFPWSQLIDAIVRIFEALIGAGWLP
jgi:hypothetical protein